MIVLLSGVSGCGKSTVGDLLASKLVWPFIDGDSLHPAANIAKMRAGIPLTDEDRWPWLEAVAAVMDTHIAAGRSAVVACSALKRSYRDLLLAGRPAGRTHGLPRRPPRPAGRPAGRPARPFLPRGPAGQSVRGPGIPTASRTDPRHFCRWPTGGGHPADHQRAPAGGRLARPHLLLARTVEPSRGSETGSMKLKLDLHDIYNRGQDIDKALLAIINEAVEKKAPVVEIISGKGSGQLKKHVLRFLEQKEIKVLYHRVEKDSKNFGRLFVHFRWK